jgi:hypothetical protein
MVGRLGDVKQGDLRDPCLVFIVPQCGCEEPAPAGVRAFIVAKKPGNSGGAKGRRKMDE